MGEHGRHAKNEKKSNYSESKRSSTTNKKNERKRKSLNILLIIFIIIFAVSCAVLVNWYITTGNSEEKYEELATEYTTIENDDSINGIINFNELKNINLDIKAWIKVEGTNIDYPVVQTTDNDYYLTNNIYKETDKSGALFFDCSNKITDKNLVIYGHNIKRGTMFADLENVYNGSLGEEVNIYLYTENRTMYFKVFSSYCTEPNENIYDTSISENDFYDFTENLKNKSEQEFSADYSLCNQILTLSTCDKSGKKRIIVHAELEKLIFTNNTDT